MQINVSFSYDFFTHKIEKHSISSYKADITKTF